MTSVTNCLLFLVNTCTAWVYNYTPTINYASNQCPPFGVVPSSCSSFLGVFLVCLGAGFPTLMWLNSSSLSGSASVHYYLGCTDENIRKNHVHTFIDAMHLSYMFVYMHICCIAACTLTLLEIPALIWWTISIICSSSLSTSNFVCYLCSFGPGSWMQVVIAGWYSLAVG